jgi:hypothetical protein
MSDMSERQASANDEDVITITVESFSLAYETWRERLCDDAIDGLSVANATPDYLLRETRHRLQHSSPTKGPCEMC